jgi:hypothetical protein
MMVRSQTLGVVSLALACSSPGLAQQFQLIVTVSPPGSQGDPANWQPTLRFGINGSGGSVTPLSNIPATEVFDPAGIAFRSAEELLIGNRHGNVLGLGSISRFVLAPDGTTVTFLENFSAPGMIGVHELAYDATRDHLFASAVFDGIFRFRFGPAGEPIFVQHFANGRQTRGVAVHPNGGFLYVSAASNLIFVFQLSGDSGVTELAPFVIPGASSLHFFCVSPDARHLYAADIFSSRVYRLRLSSDGALTLDQSTSSPSAIDLAFSPDYTEMFVGNHFGGGISRYRSADQSAWTPAGFIASPSMGGFGTFVAPGCVTDFNFDGTVDFFDYDDYVRCFEGIACPPGRDPDYNGDGTIDFFDYDDFVAAFEVGC